MDTLMQRKQSFLLRLPKSLREKATKTSVEEGTSLNHFITLAIAEKLSRMETDGLERTRSERDFVRSRIPIQAIR